ncbi:MAG: hypothetical protein JW913_03695 [Chitinispirillaceae bacterium]|nr:hypothetical protein [Chitinispirillaceae bacterium]
MLKLEICLRDFDKRKPAVNYIQKPEGAPLAGTILITLLQALVAFGSSVRSSLK